ncbi:hypothetical protein [Cytobacillus gottheilii]|uniref:hypothetical protein n=1 Tax=Cytobacillus gottheilii TaxID=859144 RepID=UPI000831EE75|nr:hypothetical protein [Cytobacillus gottheilii]
MYSWRVTKYNPIHRDVDGTYKNQDEWTSYSDIGRNVHKDEYLSTEENYINAIFAFMEEMNIAMMYLNALELKSDGVKEQNASVFLYNLWVGKAVSKREIKKLAKLTLRETIWCKLSSKKDFFVHFGYDYYMYIGAIYDCPNARLKIEDSGLFVEKYTSPYMD